MDANHEIIITDVFDAKKLIKGMPDTYRVLTIGNFNKVIEPLPDREMQEAKEHLYLEFDDVTEDLPMYVAAPEKFKLATAEDCHRALKFLEKGGHCLVHCSVGVSRSPAIALGYLLEICEDYRQAVDWLIRIKSYAKPNPYVLRLMCRILGYEDEYRTIIEYVAEVRD